MYLLIFIILFLKLYQSYKYVMKFNLFINYDIFIQNEEEKLISTAFYKLVSINIIYLYNTLKNNIFLKTYV